MPGAPFRDNSSSSDMALRRFLTRAEAATLFGMLLAVFSLFLVWKQTDYKNLPVPIPAMFAATVISQRGLDMELRWPMLLCATLAGATLLWTPTAASRPGLFVVQIAFSIGCFLMAVTHFALLPGVLVALAGSALLLFGAIDRYILPRFAEEPLP